MTLVSSTCLRFMGSVLPFFFWICGPYHDVSAKSPVLLRGHRAGFPSFLLSSPLSYPTCKPHFKNGDSYQVMPQARRQEPLLTTLHPLPAGSRIIGGQEKGQRHLGRGNPGQPPRLDCFRSMTAVSNAQPYLEEYTAAVDKNLEYLYPGPLWFLT
jgi:hypothetical protein